MPVKSLLTLLIGWHPVFMHTSLSSPRALLPRQNSCYRHYFTATRPQIHQYSNGDNSGRCFWPMILICKATPLVAYMHAYTHAHVHRYILMQCLTVGTYTQSCNVLHTYMDTHTTSCTWYTCGKSQHILKVSFLTLHPSSTNVRGWIYTKYSISQYITNKWRGNPSTEWEIHPFMCTLWVVMIPSLLYQLSLPRRVQYWTLYNDLQVCSHSAVTVICHNNNCILWYNSVAFVYLLPLFSIDISQ